MPFGHAADRLQHQVVELRLLRRRLAFEADEDAVLRRFAADRLGLEHDVVEARRVHLLPDLDQVAVGALHQAVEHLDHVEPRAERRVDRAHLEADDAAADDQHALGVLAQFERAGRVDDARIVLGQERQLHRLRAGGDDRACSNLIVCVPPSASVDAEVVRVDELAVAVHHRDLAHLGHRRQAAGQLADDLFLVRLSLARSTVGLRERDAERFEVR